MADIDPDQALTDLRTLTYIAQTIVDGGEVGDWHATMSELIDTFKRTRSVAQFRRIQTARLGLTKP